MAIWDPNLEVKYGVNNPPAPHRLQPLRRLEVERFPHHSFDSVEASWSIEDNGLANLVRDSSCPA